jgi:arabinose-5-phosphate isomerase
MAALGDALALCAMRRRGITPEEYFKRHPGGLGWRHSSSVAQVMRTGARCAQAAPETPVAQVLALISEARCGAACIVDDARRLLGVFTDGDFRRGYAKDMEIGSRPVGECMTHPCLSISSAAKIDEAQGLMHARRVNALPVVDADGRVVGLLDIQDVVG